MGRSLGWGVAVESEGEPEGFPVYEQRVDLLAETRDGLLGSEVIRIVRGVLPGGVSVFDPEPVEVSFVVAGRRSGGSWAVRLWDGPPGGSGSVIAEVGFDGGSATANELVVLEDGFGWPQTDLSLGYVEVEKLSGLVPVFDLRRAFVVIRQEGPGVMGTQARYPLVSRQQVTNLNEFLVVSDPGIYEHHAGDFGPEPVVRLRVTAKGNECATLRVHLEQIIPGLVVEGSELWWGSSALTSKTTGPLSLEGGQRYRVRGKMVPTLQCQAAGGAGPNETGTIASGELVFDQQAEPGERLARAVACVPVVTAPANLGGDDTPVGLAGYAPESRWTKAWEWRLSAVLRVTLGNGVSDTVGVALAPVGDPQNPVALTPQTANLSYTLLETPLDAVVEAGVVWDSFAQTGGTPGRISAATVCGSTPVAQRLDFTGVLEAIAGPGFGSGVDPHTVSVYRPRGVSVDSEGTLWIAEYYHHLVRRVVDADWSVAGEPGVIEWMAGNGSYCLPTAHHCGSENQKTGSVWGEGVGPEAVLANPTDVWARGPVAGRGPDVFIADRYTHRVLRLYSYDDGGVERWALQTVVEAQESFGPLGFAYYKGEDPAVERLYILYMGGNRGAIRYLDVSDLSGRYDSGYDPETYRPWDEEGMVTSYHEFDDEEAREVPLGIAVDPDAGGRIYVAMRVPSGDLPPAPSDVNQLWRFTGLDEPDYESGPVQVGDDTWLTSPLGLSFAGGKLYAANTGVNEILEITPATTSPADYAKVKIAGANDGNPYTEAEEGACATYANIRSPEGVWAVPGEDGAAQVVIGDTQNHRVRLLYRDGDCSGGFRIKTVAGNGEEYVYGEGVDAREAELWFVGPVAAPAQVANLGRTGGGMAVYEDDEGRIWRYFADTGNHRVRVIDPDGVIHTVAGNGEYADDPRIPGNEDENNGLKGVGDGSAPDAKWRLRRPTAVAVHPVTRDLYIADTAHERIRRLIWKPEANEGAGAYDEMRTLLGNGLRGDPGDPLEPEPEDRRVCGPRGLAIAVEGQTQVLFVANTDAHNVWMVNLNDPDDVRRVSGASGLCDDGDHVEQMISDLAEATLPQIAALIGDLGPPEVAAHFFPMGLAFHPADEDEDAVLPRALFVTDRNLHRIRMVTLGDPPDPEGLYEPTKIETIAGAEYQAGSDSCGSGASGAPGDGGPATADAVLLCFPQDVAVADLAAAETDLGIDCDTQACYSKPLIYIADTHHHTVRVVHHRPLGPAEGGGWGWVIGSAVGNPSTGDYGNLAVYPVYHPFPGCTGGPCDLRGVRLVVPQAVAVAGARLLIADPSTVNAWSVASANIHRLRQVEGLPPYVSFEGVS